MLTSLNIKNYALIDELQVSFNNGMTIITGETGAGKSILLGGLSLVLGKRADLSQIKDSTQKCIIEAVFDIANYNLKAVFETEDFDYDPQTIIRREILPSGKSRAFVNDTPVTLDSLTTLSGYLLDIHSQHQTLQLLDDSYQFKIIDALAKNDSLIEAYSKKLKDYKSLNQRLKDLEDSRINAKKEYDYNLFLFNELNDANLKEGELENLELTYEQLNNVEQIAEALSYAKAKLNAEANGILEQLQEIKQKLLAIHNFSPEYKDISDRINSSAIELDDVSAELTSLEDELISDPQQLEQVSNKLQTINNLLHKHSVSNTIDLIVIKDELAKKIDTTQNLDATIDTLSKEILNCEDELRAVATKISTNRRNTIPKFKTNLETIVSELGMSNAKFNIEITDANQFNNNGMDNLQFLFTANKGGQFTVLKKAASGGEMSRIMLAIKSIMANYIKLPTIMFDEIDTGVSGEISNKMGDIMKAMSKSMQVFSITHLPQIASKGDWHYKVFKTDNDKTTKTQIKKLAHNERIVEIAQMLGGTNVTESALTHAKQLLN